MKNILIDIVLNINKLFPEKDHPFNKSKNGVLDLNYTDFEYNHTKDLLDMYNKIFDINLLKNKSILDIWCWGGWKSIYIAEKYNANLTWIDLNFTFLKEANKKAKELKLKSEIKFMSESALDMTFNDNSFDFIIMSDVLEHIPNTNKLLSEALRVLKPWGYILFDFAPYYHYFWHHIWDTIRIPWLHLFTTDKFRSDLYKRSLDWFEDKQKRIDLRITDNRFTYLNKISRKEFEKCVDNLHIHEKNIKYYILKNLDFLSNIPILREIFIKHIVWFIRK